MSLRTILALLVVSSLVAGCIGGLSPSESRDLPAWTDGDEVNGSDLREAHREELLDAGSWTHRREVNSTRDGPQPSDWMPDQFSVTQWDASQRLQYTAVGVTEDNRSRRSASVTTDGVRYTRTGSPGRYEYDVLRLNESEWSFDSRLERSARGPVFDLDRWNLSYAGTAERDGRELLRFTGSNPDAIDGRVPQQVTNATMTLYVTEDGVVRRQVIRVAGTSSARPSPNERETVNVTVTHVLTWDDVGSTTVERPEWVATAQERSGNESG